MPTCCGNCSPCKGGNGDTAGNGRENTTRKKSDDNEVDVYKRQKDDVELLGSLEETNYHLSNRILTPKQRDLITTTFGSPSVSYTHLDVYKRQYIHS